MSDPFAPTLTPLEIQAVYTLLGIRFWDPALDQAVTHDLEVTAWPASQPERKSTAFRTASGVYAFRGLAGMRHLEFPVDDRTPWDEDVVPTRFVFEVKDLRRRYLPLSGNVDVPYRGIHPVGRETSPGSDPVPGLWLFSAATRASTADLAVVRAELLVGDLSSPSNPTATEPAAHAVVEVTVGGDTWHGIAGEDGQVAVFFPYPDFASPLGFTSPVTAMPPQSWSLSIRVLYEPDAQEVPDGATAPNVHSLFDQGQASIWENIEGDTVDELPLDFTFGEEPVLHTGEEFTLWLTPA
jgi:hypothetical protein